MAVFKNIKDIKLTSLSNDTLGGEYLKYCRQNIEQFLEKSITSKEFEEISKNREKEFRFNTSIDVLAISTVGRITHVKDIKYSENNSIEVILGITPYYQYDNNIHIKRFFYYQLKNTISFLGYLFSDEGRSLFLGIKKSAYNFTFKIDAAGTTMFGGVVKFYTSSDPKSYSMLSTCSYTLPLQYGGFTDVNYDINLLRIFINKYFINCEKFVKELWLTKWNLVDLSFLKDLGKIFKTKVLYISGISKYEGLDIIDNDGDRCLKHIKHILIPGGKLIIDIDIAREVKDLDDITKVYTVQLHYLE